MPAVLDKYGLRSIYPDATMPGGKTETPKHARKDRDELDVFSEALASDPKLAQLWQKAQQSGFSGFKSHMFFLFC